MVVHTVICAKLNEMLKCKLQNISYLVPQPFIHFLNRHMELSFTYQGLDALKWPFLESLQHYRSLRQNLFL